MGPHSLAAQTEGNRWRLCWRFMSGAGRRSAQLKAGDSWAARGPEREQGPGVRWGGWVQPWRGGTRGQRVREGKRENSSCPPPPSPPGRLGQDGGQRSQADLKGFGSIGLSGHGEGVEGSFSAPLPSSPIPSCPLPSPKPEAFGPFQQLCQAFGWVRAQAGEGSSCHPSPCNQGEERNEVTRLGSHEHMRGQSMLLRPKLPPAYCTPHPISL